MRRGPDCSWPGSREQVGWTAATCSRLDGPSTSAPDRGPTSRGFVSSKLSSPSGWRVVPVPVTRALHLKSGVTSLPYGTVIGYSPLVDRPETFPRFLAVPEERGTAVVGLGEGSVLISADAPRTADLLSRRRLNVVAVSITEFEKLEGCLTCLSVRLRPT